jgi:hypothetical protein
MEENKFMGYKLKYNGDLPDSRKVTIYKSVILGENPTLEDEAEVTIGELKEGVDIFTPDAGIQISSTDGNYFALSTSSSSEISIDGKTFTTPTQGDTSTISVIIRKE